MMTDPVADLLTRIRNANMVYHETVDVPASKLKKAIVEILRDEGFIKNYEVLQDGARQTLRIYLKYGSNKERVINGDLEARPAGLCPEGRDSARSGWPGDRHPVHVEGRHDR